MKLDRSLIVYLPDSRNVEISRYGGGNTKIGSGVYTYSRLAKDTCPGATPGCLSCCYALRINGPVLEQYKLNSRTDDVPPIPDECKLLRIHVGGDFDTNGYIYNWHQRLYERPDVTAWAYTRSWRVPELLNALEDLRSLPNLQLFASMDKSHTDEPPAGWRRAWIDGDPRAGEKLTAPAHSDHAAMFAYFETQKTRDETKTLICPEETKAVRNCEECGFCFVGPRNDVTFLEH